MSETLGYFLTWTTYGTWLHGDIRGSVDRHNASTAVDYLPPNPARENDSKDRMTGDPVIFDSVQRGIVDAAVREHCLCKNWQILALNARSNHVHVVVRAYDVGPDRVMNELKAYATRALRSANLIADQKVWTRGGSTCWLKTPRSLRAALRYVREQ